jgi:hypothetical protein
VISPALSLSDACADAVSSLAALATGSVGDVAVILLRHGLQPAAVLDLSDRVGVELVKGAVALADEEWDPPAGYETWAQHPWFAETPWRAEWEELLHEASYPDDAAYLLELNRRNNR